MMMLMMLMEDICRTNGTVYCQISQLHPPESLTDGGRVTFKVRRSLRPSYHGSKNHSEPASSALARLRAEPRTPDGVLYETASEDRDEDREGSEDEDKEDKEDKEDPPGLPSLPEVQMPSSVGQQLVKLPFSSSSTFTACHKTTLLELWW